MLMVFLLKGEAINGDAGVADDVERGEEDEVVIVECILSNIKAQGRRQNLGLYSSYGAIASIVTQGSEGRLRKGALVCRGASSKICNLGRWRHVSCVPFGVVVVDVEDW
jgi:hypothetical protein